MTRDTSFSGVSIKDLEARVSDVEDFTSGFTEEELEAIRGAVSIGILPFLPLDGLPIGTLAVVDQCWDDNDQPVPCWHALSPGEVGQFLRSNGDGELPEWVTPE